MNRGLFLSIKNISFFFHPSFFFFFFSYLYSMVFIQNRFSVLLGEENMKLDRFGNIEPVEKKENDQPLTHHEQHKVNLKRVPASK